MFANKCAISTLKVIILQCCVHSQKSTYIIADLKAVVSFDYYPFRNSLCVCGCQAF